MDSQYRVDGGRKPWDLPTLFVNEVALLQEKNESAAFLTSAHDKSREKGECRHIPILQNMLIPGGYNTDDINYIRNIEDRVGEINLALYCLRTGTPYSPGPRLF